ncbi:ABC-type enterochelin transport system, permease component (plasmid) [Phaeobacter inhibens]|uniref:ABC-type enterochelin transport system, permease component n=1 Tax=Phaeobacter inhibens TaxID=221822 RepID=A0ABN5GUD1_9RHOB|nr:ABC-type enterochelin transport system, permease component [Phaeobacter inhibens]AUQ97136.1 ABC-type enterochelin transport system, permease component [Phaeobacter inhibens]AUR22336.1 ABC-type enterochelin transport system, permease component [Phaeobacter inhibens]
MRALPSVADATVSAIGPGRSARGAICLCLLLLVLLAGLSCAIGVNQTSPLALLQDPKAAQLLLISRIPRTLAVILTGATMAVAGVIMQLLVRNRFVEPGTTGTNEAAMLGLLGATLLAPALPIFAKMLCAAVAALLGTLVFLALARRIPPQQPLLVPLVGLVYGGILAAAAGFIAFQADLLQYLAIWMSGEFSGVLSGRYELLWLAGVLAGLAYLVADQFTIAGLGEMASRGLGLRYGQVLGFGVVVVSLVSALVIVTVGVLPFVGLVVPNLVSRIMGDNLRDSLPVVAATGAGLLLVCDMLGRLLRAPYEIPAGTVFGLFGAALFLVMLLRRPAHG